MKTIGRIDEQLPAIESPRSLEAITITAPTLASDVISRSGADGDPRKMAPSRSSIPAAPQASSSRTWSAAPEEPDRQQRAERQLPCAERRQIEHKGGVSIADRERRRKGQRGGGGEQQPGELRQRRARPAASTAGRSDRIAPPRPATTYATAVLSRRGRRNIRPCPRIDVRDGADRAGQALGIVFEFHRQA